MFSNIKKIFNILDSEKKTGFRKLVFLMLFAMLLETIGISSMIPLINYFTDENLLALQNIDLNNFFLSLGIQEKNILNFILIFIITIFLIKNLYMALYGWLESRFAYKVRFDLGSRLFNNYLNNTYLFHVENNSSNLITKITQETSIFGGALIQLSTLLTEILIIFGITIFLLVIKPLETSIIILIGFLLSFTFYLLVKNTVSRLGKKRETAQKALIKSLQQGLGAIKDIIIYKVQKKFINSFNSNSEDLAEAGFKMYFLQKLPRIWFEITTITIITFIIFYLSMQQLETSAIMATMGIFLVSSLKIIPSINRILVSLQSIKYSEPSFNSLITDLKETNYDNRNISPKNLNNNKLTFHNEIKFKNVFFNYPKLSKPALKNINLTIKKNQFVGIVGETGAGKSTLVDLLMGLIEPGKGTITVDGENINKKLSSWRNKLGYVPQNLYLLDEPIQNNIAFGFKENEILKSRIEESVDQSQLTKFINNLKYGINTIVGERGIKISGGEKQRIAIARALYNNPEILIFDEATSSLDLDTEKKILETLTKFKKVKTLIFITHRKSNLHIFDRIFKIENNEVEEIEKNKSF